MFRLTKFKKVFFIRFLSFAFIQVGFLSILITFEPVVVEEFRYQLNNLLGTRHSLPQVVTSATQNEASLSSGFSDLPSETTDFIKPVSTDFGIVIEKINANAKIVEGVDAGNEGEYLAALSKGVAHAKGTVLPGERGNMYLFSHSVNAPWNIVRFNAVFYLLKDMERGDKVVIFFNGRRFDYVVVERKITEPEDVSYFTLKTEEQILVLQTCYPPGTTWKRLLVIAKPASAVAEASISD